MTSISKMSRIVPVVHNPEFTAFCDGLSPPKKDVKKLLFEMFRLDMNRISLDVAKSSTAQVSDSA